LKRLNRNPKNIILLDNNPLSYYLDVENGLPIKSFYDDKTDKELINLTFILEQLAKVNDVREYIKEIVYMNHIDYDRAKEVFNSLSSNSNTISIAETSLNIQIPNALTSISIQQQKENNRYKSYFKANSIKNNVNSPYIQQSKQSSSSLCSNKDGEKQTLKIVSVEKIAKKGNNSGLNKLYVSHRNGNGVNEERSTSKKNSTVNKTNTNSKNIINGGNIAGIKVNSSINNGTSGNSRKFSTGNNGNQRNLSSSKDKFNNLKNTNHGKSISNTEADVESSCII
jgi:hypothetical protein